LPATAFDRRNQHLQAHRQTVGHHQPRQRQHMGGSAHVLLHQRHAAGGFQVQSARVEAHALADQAQQWRVLVPPVQFDQTRRPAGCAADGVDGRKIAGQQLLADDDLDLGAEGVGLPGDRVGQVGRPHVLGRRIDQVTHQVLRLAQGAHVICDVCVQQQQRPRLAVGFIALEAIAGQAPTQGGLQALLAGPVTLEPVHALGQNRRQGSQLVQPALLLHPEQPSGNPALAAG
jgi:hypothetical protein